MTDLENVLRRVDEFDAPDLWPNIAERAGSHPNGPLHRPAWRLRVLTIGVALSLAAAGVGIIVVAFHGEEGPAPSRPTPTEPGTINGAIAFLRTTQPSEVPYDVQQGIWTLDLRTQERLSLYQPPSSALLIGLSWSPDGASMAFAMLDDQFGPTRLYLMSASGGQPQEIYSCEGTACMSAPAWAPDGTRIAFAEQGTIYTVALDGSTREVLLECPPCTRIEGSVAWSADGSHIAFAVTQADYGGAIYVADVESGILERIAECVSALCVGGLRDSSPTWAPDGNWIAFTRERNVWRIRPDGAHLAKLTDCPESLRFSPCTLGSPVWSPDGRMIAYQGTDGFYIMKSDGSDPRRVGEGTLLGWQPLHEEPDARSS